MVVINVPKTTTITITTTILRLIIIIIIIITVVINIASCYNEKDADNLYFNTFIHPVIPAIVKIWSGRLFQREYLAI